MLKTEMRNPYTMNFDKMTSAEMVEAMCRENMNAALAVEAASESIAKAIDIVAEVFNSGKRLYLIGCGTSGRLGVIDAAECPEAADEAAVVVDEPIAVKLLEVVEAVLNEILEVGPLGVARQFDLVHCRKGAWCHKKLLSPSS